MAKPEARLEDETAGNRRSARAVRPAVVELPGRSGKARPESDTTLGNRGSGRAVGSSVVELSEPEAGSDDDGSYISDEPDAQGRNPRTCCCRDESLAIMLACTRIGDIAEQVRVLQCLRESSNFEELCHNHLRRFAGSALGLLTNITKLRLRERLNYLFKERATMAKVREANGSWFRNQGTDVWRFEVPPLIKGADFGFDAKEIFTRFAGPGAWEPWERDGTIILPGLFDYLAVAAAEIDDEFEMYAFHQSQGTARMGWTRNMYHSGVQQLMYQDPIFYALTAAARPDKQWRLIAYPYITKEAQAGESTGFVHVDLNLRRARDERLGLNRVQGSVSLDDENEQGCTLVVPGFHKRFDEFLQWNRFAITKSDATTTGMKEYGTVEKAKFGQLVPTPCPAYGAKLSLSMIIHGSTKAGTRRRRVLFPWFTAIMDDHETVEHPDCMQWQAIADSHERLTGPLKESLGDTPRPGVAGHRFAGTVQVRSSYALCLALVGQKRWTDRDVEMERDILLGSDAARSRELAADMRAQLLHTYKLRWKLMRERELQAFGEESFFRRNERKGD